MKVEKREQYKGYIVLAWVDVNRESILDLNCKKRRSEGGIDVDSNNMKYIYLRLDIFVGDGVWLE